jgi:hypothetical protein
MGKADTNKKKGYRRDHDNQVKHDIGHWFLFLLISS